MNHKVFLILLGATLLASCKKNRTCTCTVTTSGTTETRTSSIALGIDTSVVTPMSTVNEYRTTLSKMSKRKAKFNCFDKTDEVNESSTNGLPGLMDITVTNTGTRAYDCKLEK